ncbi:MAG: hypothetical protein LAO06_18175 [Acidobacteriia bacterium]|nr:hypothetical protein [Terriglobia bacterium]
MLRGYDELGKTVLLTQGDLQKALTTMLGELPQVTCTSWDINAALAKHHWAIAWEEWQAAAEAAGLVIERERGSNGCVSGWTIYKAGAQKLTVPEARATAQYSGLFDRPPGTPAGRAALADASALAQRAEATAAGTPGGVPGDVRGDRPNAEKIAAEAAAFVKQEALAGRTVSCSVAVAAIMKKNGWRHDTT